LKKIWLDFRVKALILTFVFLCTLSLSVTSQDNKSDYVTFEKVVTLLETKHGKRFFYKEEWFHDLKFHVGMVDLNFHEAIEVITSRAECRYVLIDSTIVLIPLSLAPVTESFSGDKVIQVGNPRDLGKSSKATFSGRVLDGKTREPLIGAILYDENLHFGTSTDLNGNFSITLPVGDHNLKISYVGYEDMYQALKIYSTGSADIEIFEKSVNIEGVYVYSERPEMNITRTQMSISKLNSKNIKELPVSIGEVDIVKSLTLLPGVQSVGEFGAGFNVRGGSADQNLILVEDVPLFNSSHLFGLTSAINSDAINNVTLIKAGTPAKYGERVSSVMDIKMSQASGDKLKGRAGIGLINSKLFLEAPLWKNKIGLTIGGRTSYSDWLLRKMPDIDLMNSKANFYDLNGLLQFNINSKNKVSLFGYQSFDRFAYSSNTAYSYKNILSSIKWYHIISRNITFNLVAGISNYSYTLQEKDSIRLFNAYKINSSLSYRMIKGNFLYTPSKSHTIEFGVNVLNYLISPGNLKPLGANSSIIPFKLSNEKAYELGFYVADNITVSTKLGIEVGLRYSNFILLGPGSEFVYEENKPLRIDNIVDTVSFANNSVMQKYGGIEPRVNLRFLIDEFKSFKLSYSRINQYINLASNTSSMAPTDTWKLSNKYLKPLKSDQLALGYFNNFMNNSIETSIEVFYKKLENVLEYKNGVKVVMNPNLEADLLNAKGYNVGLELYVKKNTGKLGGWVSYTLSRSMRKTNGIWDEEQINKNNYFPSNYDKTHNLIINTNYYISQRWRFAATFTYNTGRPVTLPEHEYYINGYKYIYYSDRNEYRLPDYHRLDVSITLGESLRLRKKWKGSFTFSVINLYGRKNAYSVFYQRNSTSISNNDYNLYKLYIIGRPFPTLTYNISF